MRLEKLEIGFAIGIGGGLCDVVAFLEEGGGDGSVGWWARPENVVVVGKSREEHAEEEAGRCARR